MTDTITSEAAVEETAVVAPAKAAPAKGKTAKQREREANPEPTVQCKVSKKGDGKISTGEHIGGEGDLTYGQGDVITVPRTAALATLDEDGFEGLEERGYVEVLG